MSTLDCLHESDGSAHQICSHLLEKLLSKERTGYVRMFTGQGREYFLICPTCKKLESDADIPWCSVCHACFQQIQKEPNYWNDIRGTPEVTIKPSNLAFTHRYSTKLAEFLVLLRLVQPVPHAHTGTWIGLTALGSLVEFDTNAETHRQIANLSALDFDSTMPLSLVCSLDGRFVCIAQTLGDQGVVIDTHSGACVMRLQRDGYQTDVTPFSIAFVEHDGRTLLVHASEWNRLDISDPATGELLTERGPTSYQREEERPAHYLDYFHGNLLVSPDQTFIADDGWGWHPYGLIHTWNIQRWITENVWESEDGSSLRNFAFRAYFWGAPMCWIDNQTLAVWGYGRDTPRILPAAWLFDVVSGEERGWFPGPEVLEKTGVEGFDHLADSGGRFFFDTYLFSVSEVSGIAVWDIVQGARLHQDSSFSPVTYHPVTREFLTLQQDGRIQVSRLVEG